MKGDVTPLPGGRMPTMCLGWGVVGADCGGAGTLKDRRGFPERFPRVELPPLPPPSGKVELYWLQLLPREEPRSGGGGGGQDPQRRDPQAWRPDS